MSGLRVHTVTTDDGAHLAAYVREPDGPARATVVLGHGWVLDHRSWAPVVDRLDPSLRVVLWDQRGHGRSTLADGRNRVGHESVRRLGHDLAAVLDQIVPDDDRVILAGHSMGGMTVMAYAGIDPDAFTRRVSGVLLVSTAAGDLRGTGRPGEAFAMKALSHLPAKIGRAITEKGHRAMAFGPQATKAQVHEATLIVRGTRASTFGGYFAALMAHDEYASLSALDAVPTTVLVGEQDKLTPPILARRLADSLPKAQLTQLPERGHMLTWEATDDVVNALHALALEEDAR